MALPMDLNWFGGGFIRGENGIGGADHEIQAG